MVNDYRYFTLHKLDNKVIEFGRVKISSSATPLDAAKKLLKSICDYKGLKKNNKLKCKSIYYIRETTKKTNKKIYGPYKGSYKKYDKPVIVKLKDNSIIKHTMYPHVFKIKDKEKLYIQKGGNPSLKLIAKLPSDIYFIYKLLDGTILVSTSDDGVYKLNNDILESKNSLNSKNSLKPKNINIKSLEKLNIKMKKNSLEKYFYVNSIIEIEDYILFACNDGTIQIFNKDFELIIVINITDLSIESIIKLDEKNIAFYYNQIIVVCELSVLIPSELPSSKLLKLNKIPREEIKTRTLHDSIKSIVKISNNKILIILENNVIIWDYEINSKNEINQKDIICAIKLNDDSFVLAHKYSLIFYDSTYIHNYDKSKINYQPLPKNDKDYNIAKMIQLENGNIVCYCVDKSIKIWKKNNNETTFSLSESLDLPSNINTDVYTCVQLVNGKVLSGHENGYLFELSLDTNIQHS
jgi:hypothetical protein